VGTEAVAASSDAAISVAASHQQQHQGSHHEQHQKSMDDAGGIADEISPSSCALGATAAPAPTDQNSGSKGVPKGRDMGVGEVCDALERR
jgi:hypothetical protein